MEFSWSKIKQWYKESPRRAIDRAYESALAIQDLEAQYFNGNIITDDGRYGSGTLTVIQTQLQNHLNTIRLKLVEYRLSNIAPGNWQTTVLKGFEPTENLSPADKLAVIDQCLSRYELNPIDRPPPTPARSGPPSPERSIIPVSIIASCQQLATTLFSSPYTPEMETTRRRTLSALRFFVSIIVIAIVVQWGSRNLIYSPIIDLFNDPRSVEIKFTDHFKTEALAEFQTIKEAIALENLVAELRGTPTDRRQEAARLKTAVKELVINYNYKSLAGIKNLLADLTSGLFVYLFIIVGKSQITIVKEFLYDTLAGLSDSARAFLIIVSTDTFVGYHSRDGWDALIRVLFDHFGLPESAVLTDTFIATVPVFLDASFKFWIFQYLRQASPTTSAIYREMNE